MSVQILVGDVRAMLATLPDESVHCVVTSPPYWGLRCYGVDGQIGQEPTLGEHVEVIVEVFREVRRVLRKDGTVWLNYGDCYASHDPGGYRPGEFLNPGGKQPKKKGAARNRAGNHRPDGLKPKDLCMMPARVALALQADGWWLRSEIIWHKPNPMPESITDRPTSSHEKIYLLARSKRYYFDAEAVREASDEPERQRNDRIGGATGHLVRHSEGGMMGQVSTRNIRNVWTIATAPYPGAHFATFPPALVEPCIKAGTSEKGCCPECGAPWVREVDKERTFESGSGRAGNMPSGKNGPNLQGGGETLDIRRGPVVHTKTLGWRPSCNCFCIEPGGKQVPHFAKPCVVLDPFGGAGTVGLVADRLKRDAILIELNPDYAAMARERVQADGGMFAEVAHA